MGFGGLLAIAGAAATSFVFANIEHVTFQDGDDARTRRSRTTFALGFPLAAHAESGFNRAVYEELSERHAERGADGALVVPPLLVIERRAALSTHTYRYEVPYAAIDGGSEYGEGGLMAAYLRDTFFTNRLQRYLQ